MLGVIPRQWGQKTKDSLRLYGAILFYPQEKFCHMETTCKELVIPTSKLLPGNELQEC